MVELQKVYAQRLKVAFGSSEQEQDRVIDVLIGAITVVGFLL